MSIDPLSSHHPLLPYGPGGLAGAHGAPPNPGARFARVIGIEEARVARTPIPEEVQAEMAHAAELVDRLAERGQRVSFDVHHLSGEIVASLVDERGTAMERIPLVDVVAGLSP